MGGLSAKAYGFKSPFRVGSIGPGGGVVIYDAGSVQSWGRYIEAVKDFTFFNNYSWASGFRITTAMNTTSTAIGTGAANTTEIINHGNTGVAATAARAHNGGGFTDWCLPSKDELNQIYINRAYLSFSPGSSAVWSSSEHTNPASFATNQVFSTGVQSFAGKGTQALIIPVRYFS